MPGITRPVLALPAHEVTLDDVVEHLERTYADTPDLDRALHAVRGCGVETRRHCRSLDALAHASLGQRVQWHFDDVCDFGEAAAKRALADAGVTPADVDAVIAVTTASYQMPGLDVVLIERLGLPPTVRRMPLLHMGCAGAPAALAQAVEQAAASTGQAVLVVCADMVLPFVHTEDTTLDSMIFRGLLGDGAAACVVLSDDDGPTITDFWNYTEPGTPDVVGHQLDDHGFHGFNSPRLLTAVDTLVPRLAEWLGGPPEFVVAHPGGPRVLTSLAAGLDVDPALLETARHSLAERGNMGATSMMDTLARTFDHPPAPNSRGALIGIGPGVTLTAAKLTWR